MAKELTEGKIRVLIAKAQRGYDEAGPHYVPASNVFEATNDELLALAEMAWCEARRRRLDRTEEG